MAANADRPWKQPWFWVEIFTILNLGFLTFDIFLAHSVNDFRRHAEYIPLYFSALAPVVLLVGLLYRRQSRRLWAILGFLVGAAAIVIGMTGVVLHLDSSFFYERTIRSLTYSAPFAAPLAYAGLGFLLVLNRMVDSASKEWAEWVLLFALGGFIGNFVFSLTDHASNGFFVRVEWVPVIASALAVGFLLTPLMIHVPRRFLDLCAPLLLMEAAVGAWGFVLHAARNLSGPSLHPFENFISGRRLWRRCCFRILWSSRELLCGSCADSRRRNRLPSKNARITAKRSGYRRCSRQERPQPCIPENFGKMVPSESSSGSWSATECYLATYSAVVSRTPWIPGTSQMPRCKFPLQRARRWLRATSPLWSTPRTSRMPASRWKPQIRQMMEAWQRSNESHRLWI